MKNPPPLTGILETALYVTDVSRSVRFYADLLGIEPMQSDERFAALPIAAGQVLLLFKEGASTQPMATAGGVIPPHDGHGQSHMAFGCSAEELPRWEGHLSQQGIAIESRVHWNRGGESVYFRDPDGNLLELATPGVWQNY